MKALKKIVVVFTLLIIIFTSFSCYPKSNENLPDLIPYRKGDKWGFCDRNKKIVIEPVYDDVYPFYEGLALVFDGKDWGYVDTKGNVVIPLGKYEEARSFSEGLVAVELNGKWGYIDTKGNLVINT